MIDVYPLVSKASAFLEVSKYIVYNIFGWWLCDMSGYQSIGPSCSRAHSGGGCQPRSCVHRSERVVLFAGKICLMAWGFVSRCRIGGLSGYTEIFRDCREMMMLSACWQCYRGRFGVMYQRMHRYTSWLSTITENCRWRTWAKWQTGYLVTNEAGLIGRRKVW